MLSIIKIQILLEIRWKMEKILIVEDDDTVRNELGSLLSKNGYEVLTTEDYLNVSSLIIEKVPNLVLLDINLPNTDGFELCKQIRSKVKTPIIFVTSRNTDIDELKSITLGGDDFITKPYNIPILLARIATILKRSDPGYNKDIVYKDVVLNTHLSTVKYMDNVTELTKNEFRILYYFFINPGKVISKDELVEYLWNNKLYVDENILNVNVTRLRKKLLEIGLDNFIETIHGRGYKI